MEDNKKDDDYSIKMPMLDSGRGSPSPPRRSSSHKGGAIPLPVSQITNSPPISIAAYCLASISMTVINKYCVSNPQWNMSFFFLAFQVCTYIPCEYHELLLIHHSPSFVSLPFKAARWEASLRTWLPLTVRKRSDVCRIGSFLKHDLY